MSHINRTRPVSSPNSPISDKVCELLNLALVWDNHACMPLRPDTEFLPQLERMRGAGFNIVTLNVGFDLTTLENSFRVLAEFRSWVAQNNKHFLLISNTEDIRNAKATGRLGLVFDLEGLSCIGQQISLIDLYYDLGVRWALLAYNKSNLLGGGCQDGEEGLTALGREAIERMEQVGMVPCCSHMNRTTASDILNIAEGPVIFSHSNPSAVFYHPRNISDDLIKACAETGGVIGVNGISRFMGFDREKLDNSTETLFRHIDHVVQLVGPEHVGLGLDYIFDTNEVVEYFASRPDLFPPEKGYSGPAPMVEPERLPQIVQVMIDHGYSEASIICILGGNHFRVAQTCWK